MKLPFMKFYPSDWIKDTRSLSPEAKAAWVDFLMFSWSEAERGRLTLTVEDWARTLGQNAEKMGQVLHELGDKGIASVTEHNGKITLESRRIVREHLHYKNNANRQARFRQKHQSNEKITPQKSEVRSQNTTTTDNTLTLDRSNTGGESGGSATPPTARKKFEKPTAEMVAEYGKSISFMVDGQQFVDFYESKGWLIGKTPMKDWRAAVRTWKKRRETGGAQGGKIAGEAKPIEGKYANVS